jgi:hypothetical protein
LRRVVVTSDIHARPVVLFTWGKVDPLRLALEICKGAYVSHGTALRLHNLWFGPTDYPIHLNREQTAKPRPEGHLTQEGIDRAFSNSQRSSRNIQRWDDNAVVLVNGKNTGRFAVTSIEHEDRIVPVSSIERTLIDVVVRPAYAGGVANVFRAFRKASNSVSVDSLVSILDRLDYVYPYHQAIGFYLQRAGMRTEALTPLMDRGAKFNFYIAHGLQEQSLDDTWRVFYDPTLFTT